MIHLPPQKKGSKKRNGGKNKEVSKVEQLDLECENFVLACELTRAIWTKNKLLYHRFFWLFFPSCSFLSTVCSGYCKEDKASESVGKAYIQLNLYDSSTFHPAISRHLIFLFFKSYSQERDLARLHTLRPIRMLWFVILQSLSPHILIILFLLFLQPMLFLLELKFLWAGIWNGSWW